MQRISADAVAFAMLSDRLLPLEGESLAEVSARNPTGRPIPPWESGASWHRGGVILPLEPSRSTHLAINKAEDRIEMQLELGGASLQTWDGMVTIRVPGELPRALLAAAVGRSVRDVVGHPLLDGDDYVVTETYYSPIFDDSAILFPCDTVPWRIGAPPSARLSIHADPFLCGDDAVADVVDRMAAWRLVDPWDARLLLFNAFQRIRRVNLGQTAAAPLPDPTMTQAIAAIAKLSIPYDGC